MGQCGLGHVNSPIVRPAKVKLGLDGVPIHQISAGTSHSMAWTTLPSDKRSIAWQKPFCVDLNVATFEVLRKLLLFSNEDDKMPVVEKNHLAKSVLKILGAHLALVSSAMQHSHLMPEIAEDERAELEKLLYRFMDLDTCSEDIIFTVKECLNKGVNILLPCMPQRIKIASNLLALDRNVIKKSEQENLRLILQSINDPKAIGWLVLLCQDDESLVKNVMTMLQILIRKESQLLVRMLHLVNKDPMFNGLVILKAKNFENGREANEEVNFDSIRREEATLLFTLHVHFILFNLSGIKDNLVNRSFVIFFLKFDFFWLQKSFKRIEELTEDYLKMVFTVGQDLLEHCRFVLKSENSVSLAAANQIFQEESSLVNILHLTLVSLFDIPLDFTRKLRPELVGLHRSSMALQKVAVDNINDWLFLVDLNALASALISHTLSSLINLSPEDVQLEQDTHPLLKPYLSSDLLAMHRTVDLESLGRET